MKTESGSDKTEESRFANHHQEENATGEEQIGMYCTRM